MSKEKWTEDFYKLDPLNVSTEMVKIEAMKWAYFEGRKLAEQEMREMREVLEKITDLHNEDGSIMQRLAYEALERGE